jgi:hypothetical protein
MKKTKSIVAILILLLLPALALSAKPVQVEVLYMNHGPLQPTLQKLDKLLSGYGSKISVIRYDFESPEGEQFMTRKGIKEHMPLAIWIDGRNTVPIDTRKITFAGFPTGSGPAFFQGKWTLDDLKKCLDHAIR